jgi:hypothetical protein
MILDGNQRIRACRKARIEPRYTEFTGTEEEALDMVWDFERRASATNRNTESNRGSQINVDV